MECVQLRIKVHRAERLRSEARARFEAHTSVGAAQAAALAYREAADELNRALAMLAMHRKAHEAASKDDGRIS